MLLDIAGKEKGGQGRAPSPYQLLLDKLHWLNHVRPEAEVEKQLVLEWALKRCRGF